MTTRYIYRNAISVSDCVDNDLADLISALFRDTRDDLPENVDYDQLHYVTHYVNEIDDTIDLIFDAPVADLHVYELLADRVSLYDLSAYIAFEFRRFFPAVATIPLVAGDVITANINADLYIATISDDDAFHVFKSDNPQCHVMITIPLDPYFDTI